MSCMKYFAFTVLILSLWSCSDEIEELNIDFGYEYFPLEVGNYRIYQVDSIIYDPLGRGVVIDSTSSQVREMVTNTLLDNTGASIYRLERHVRKTEADPWLLEKVFVQSTDERRAFQIEDNLRVIKLPFPLQAGAEWNAHVFFDSSEIIVPVAGESINIYKDWSWEVLGVNESVNLNNLSFDQVATIQLSDSENLIELRRATEQYAKGIGLVYREMDILDTQCNACCGGDFSNCSNLEWGLKAEKGFSLRQRLIEHN